MNIESSTNKSIELLGDKDQPQEYEEPVDGSHIKY